MVLGHYGEEHDIGVGLVDKIVAMPHGAIVYLACGDGFFFSVEIESEGAVEYEDNLAVSVVDVLSAACAGFQYVAHDAAFAVYESTHVHFALSAFEIHYHVFFQLVRVYYHNALFCYRLG